MPRVIRISDEPNLVPTRLYPYASFPFDDFNVVQSGLFSVYDRDANVCIAASTSAGKTACAEMMLAHEIHSRGGKGMYISPLKSLAQEKIDDWTEADHHFSGLNLSICTGDYTLTESRKKELHAANLIIMTSEMLASRTRNWTSEKNTWIKEVGTIAIDESHLITVPGRGDHLEVAIMKLCEINPNIRILFLSATLPNVDEVCGWISKLTNKDTYLLESKYRPCPLSIHYEQYEEYPNSYDETEASKIWTAEQIIDQYPEDKVLVFAHTKRTGEMARRRFQEKGISCEFHNADLTKEKRIELESKFKRSIADGGLRVLVATSTLAWGINAPARRVIILGLHRGMNLVPTYDIAQMMGRAGRPRYDPAGDAYILLPHSRKKYLPLKEHCQTPTLIQSQLLTYVGKNDEEEGSSRHYKTLAFHIVSEIHRNQIQTRKCFRQWFKRSLAFSQAKDLDAEIVDNVIGLLIRCGAIREEDGILSTTPVGTIASMLYYSPFDVSDFKRNFSAIFRNGDERDDIKVSIALGNIDSNRFGICSRAEREEIGDYARRLVGLYGADVFTDAAVKAGYCYYTLMHGRSNPILAGAIRGLQVDADRTTQVLLLIDQMASKWNKKHWLHDLKSRVKYGVPGHLAPFCGLPDIGAVRAKRLYDAGLKSLKDVAANPDAVAIALKFRRERAEELSRLASTMVGKDFS